MSNGKMPKRYLWYICVIYLSVCTPRPVFTSFQNLYLHLFSSALVICLYNIMHEVSCMRQGLLYPEHLIPLPILITTSCPLVVIWVLIFPLSLCVYYSYFKRSSYVCCIPTLRVYCLYIVRLRRMVTLYS